MRETIQYDQYFLTYSGIKLPLKLVSPITSEEVENRNTYFGACLDGDGRISLIHKRVYGEIELNHRYGYDSEGNLLWAEIRGIDEEGHKLHFDASGGVTAQETLPAEDV